LTNPTIFDNQLINKVSIDEAKTSAHKTLPPDKDDIACSLHSAVRKYLILVKTVMKTERLES